jgi:glycerol-3-phosphate dehydrogenase
MPIDGTAGYLPVELLRAVTHEGATTLDDVLSRRTHIAIEDPEAGTGAAVEVAALVAPVLGWDETRQQEEVAGYRAQPHLSGIL